MVVCGDEADNYSSVLVEVLQVNHMMAAEPDDRRMQEDNRIIRREQEEEDNQAINQKVRTTNFNNYLVSFSHDSHYYN